MTSLARITSGLIFALVAVPAAGQATTRPADQADPRVTPVVLAHRKAGPAVFNVSAERIAATRMKLPGFSEEAFPRAFPSPFRRRMPVQSLGSGVVIHPDGDVPRNAHFFRL